MVEHVFHPMCVPVTKRTLVSNVKRVRILENLLDLLEIYEYVERMSSMN